MQKQGFYGEIADNVWQKATKIKLVICDVDGVLSDGRIYLGNNGEELKAFHTRDGYGVRSLLSTDFQVAIITGRQSQLVEKRMSSLGITDIYQGVDDKLQPFNKLLKKYQLQADEVTYIGDDIVDLPVMKQVGLAVCVADAHPFVKQHAHMVTYNAGGFGAVRELADLLLLSQNKFDSAHGMSV